MPASVLVWGLGYLIVRIATVRFLPTCGILTLILVLLKLSAVAPLDGKVLSLQAWWVTDGMRDTYTRTFLYVCV